MEATKEVDMKLNFWQKFLAWLVEWILPKVLAMALAKIKVDEIIAAVTPFIQRIVNKIPTAFHASLKDLLAKLGDFFSSLAKQI